MDSGSADFWVGAEQCQTVVQQAAGGAAGAGDGAAGGDTGAGQGAAARSLGRRTGGSGATQAGAAAQAAGAGQAAQGGVDCGNHTFLGTQSSSSLVDTKAPFQVTYGSGAVTGTIVTDNINVAGLALDKHTFGTAQGETEQFTGAPFDGLMGLAQSV